MDGTHRWKYVRGAVCLHRRGVHGTAVLVLVPFKGDGRRSIPYRTREMDLVTFGDVISHGEDQQGRLPYRNWKVRGHGAVY